MTSQLQEVFYFKQNFNLWTTLTCTQEQTAFWQYFSYFSQKMTWYFLWFSLQNVKFLIYDMSRAMRKGVRSICGQRRSRLACASAQSDLGLRRPQTVIRYCRMCQWRANVRMKLCTCAVLCESTHLAHARRHHFAWHGPYTERKALTSNYGRFVLSLRGLYVNQSSVACDVYFWWRTFRMPQYRFRMGRKLK